MKNIPGILTGASLAAGVAALGVASFYANTLSVPKQSVVLLLTAIAAALAGMGQAVAPLRRPPGAMIFMWVTAGYFLVRALCSPIRDLAHEDMVLIATAALAFFVFARTPGGGKWLLSGIVLATLVQVVAAMMQRSGAYPAHPTGRLSGLFGHYNYFADFVGAGLLAAITAAIWMRRNALARGGLIVLAAGCLPVLYWSQSRGTAVALVVAGMALLALSYFVLPAVAVGRRKYYLLAISSMLVGGVLAGGYGVVHIFNQKAEGADGLGVLFASTLRIYFVPMAVEQFQDAPLFGTGSRTFSYLCFQHWNPNIAADRPNPEFVHNEHVQVLAEYGLAGYLLVVSFVGYAVWAGVAKLRRLALDGEASRDKIAIPMAGVCILVFSCMHAVVDFTMHLTPNLLLAVAGAAMVHGSATGGRELQTSSRETMMASRLLLLPLLPVIVFAGSFSLAELRAGMALASAGITREVGTWYPPADRVEACIVAYERAVSASPTFRRYERLAMCYQASAAVTDDHAKVAGLLKQAEYGYSRSFERNPLNPVAGLSLANVLADQGKWAESDDVFRNTMPMAVVREPWLHGLSNWSGMHAKWALAEWKAGRPDAAEEHFAKSRELAEACREIYRAHRDVTWLTNYTRDSIYYARFLTSQRRFKEAGRIYQSLYGQAKKDLTEPKTKLTQNYAAFLFARASHVWRNDRDTELAAKLLLESEKQYHRYRNMVSGKVDAEWEIGYRQLQLTMRFFRQTGLLK